jgi:hypothetical protein
MKETVNIVWFKRDLRINDHHPLLAASKLGVPILPLYVVEPDYWQQSFSSSRHWHFIYDCLSELNIALTQLGQPLIVQVGETCDVIARLYSEYIFKRYTHTKKRETSGPIGGISVLMNYALDTISHCMNTRSMALLEDSVLVMIGQLFGISAWSKKSHQNPLT